MDQGGVSNRFVSEKSLEEARAARAEEWKKTYERLGQEPPPQPEEQEYDPRTLYEKLKEQKDKKQEAFEEQLKFKNQFRGLDEEETRFLEDMREEQAKEKSEKDAEMQKELAAFREAAIQKSATNNKSIDTTSSTSSLLHASKAKKQSTSSASSLISTLSNKKKRDQKSLLAGAIKKKSSTSSNDSSSKKRSFSDNNKDEQGKEKEKEEETSEKKLKTGT